MHTFAHEDDDVVELVDTVNLESGEVIYIKPGEGAYGIFSQDL